MISQNTAIKKPPVVWFVCTVDTTCVSSSNNLLWATNINQSDYLTDEISKKFCSVLKMALIEGDKLKFESTFVLRRQFYTIPRRYSYRKFCN